MTVGKMSLNEKAIMLSFVYMQVIMLVIAAIVVSSMPDKAMLLFSKMPPVSAIYDSVGATWMSNLRHFSHGMIALSNIVLSIIVMMIGMKSTSSIIKFLTGILGVQLLGNGLLNSAEVLMLEGGGFAHLVSIVIALTVSLTSILMMLMTAMKIKYIKDFRDAGDLSHQPTEK